MPSGRTHDRITLWCLPFVAALAFGQTQSSNLTLLVSGSYLFGGLMFGPDLDIYSCQYQRWGWFRGIWLPYQKSLNHRSFLSHGPLIGTALRVLYLASWILLLGICGVAIAEKVGNVRWNWEEATAIYGRSIWEHRTELFAVYVGLELGAMSHYLSDWSGSAYKRFKKQGLGGLHSRSKIKRPRRKPTSRPPAKSRK